MNVQMQEEENFAMAFRIPDWSEETYVTINGEPVKYTICAGYLTIKRNWKNDTIELSFDSRVKVHMVEDLKYMKVGPIILARDARLNVDVTSKLKITESDSIVQDIIQSHPKIKANVMYSIATVDGVSDVIDYASAGKTWKEDSKMSVKIN